MYAYYSILYILFSSLCFCMDTTSPDDVNKDIPLEIYNFAKKKLAPNSYVTANINDISISVRPTSLRFHVPARALKDSEILLDYNEQTEYADQQKINEVIRKIQEISACS